MLAACNQVSDETIDRQDATPVTLGPEGWGALKIGMSRAEVVAAVGENATAAGAPVGEPGQCELFPPARAPEGMLVMIENDRLTRITLRQPSKLKTARGFTVGDPAAAIKKAYGAEAQVTPHKYEPAPAEYITVWTTPGSSGVVYEIGTDGHVRFIHAGGSSIQYVEGCG